MRKPYPSDLNDEEWAILGLLIPPGKPGGRPRSTDMREVLNTLFYQERSGCQWNMLPHDLLPKSTVYEYFSQWRDDGTWQAMLDALREMVRTSTPKPQPSPPSPPTEPVAALPATAQAEASSQPTSNAAPPETPGPALPLPQDRQGELVHLAAAAMPSSPPEGGQVETAESKQTENAPAGKPEGGSGCGSGVEYREATPSLVIIDSQSTKTTEVGGADRGYDGGKKIKGRKRHIIVDSLGMLVAVLVTSAAVDDGVAACMVAGQLDPKKFPRLVKWLGDNKYHNQQFYAMLHRHSDGKWQLEISRRPKGSKGFVPLKLRWPVERTFAWLGRSRRLAKDYERLPASSEAHCKISMIHLMVKRLKPAAQYKLSCT
jgi:transposase